MQMEGDRLPIPDANISEEVEEVQFEMNQKLGKLTRRGQAKRCGSGKELEEKTGIKILPEPRNEKLSEPFMQLECEALPVPDANAAEEKQFELTEKLSQRKRRSRGCPRGSRNTESNRAVRSGINPPSQRKRKTEKANTEPIRASKWLAGVTADPNSKCGTGKRSRRANTRKIEQPESTVPKESEGSRRSHNEDALLTDELQEKLERLKPFMEQASQGKQADQPKPTVSKDSNAGCLPNQKDTPIINELLERFQRLKPSGEQASRVQQAGQRRPTVPKDSDARCWAHPSDSPDTDQLQEKFRRLKPFAEQNSKEQPVHPLASTPFGDSWLDPCIEFAFKTLTSDFPILEDVASIQAFFNNQLISSKSPNASAGSIQLALDCPSLGNVKVHKNCQQR